MQVIGAVLFEALFFIPCFVEDTHITLVLAFTEQFLCNSIQLIRLGLKVSPHDALYKPIDIDMGHTNNLHLPCLILYDL